MIQLSDQTTPVGDIRIAIRGEELVGLVFMEAWPLLARHLARWFGDEEVREGYGPREMAMAGRLEAYLAGELDALRGIPLETVGTDFQRRVWAAVQHVPAGEALTYTELAMTVEAPNAVRAVGTACGANPIELVIPCHRVVRSDGAIGDYPGGRQRKEWLLDHERRHARS